MTPDLQRVSMISEGHRLLLLLLPLVWETGDWRLETWRPYHQIGREQGNSRKRKKGQTRDDNQECARMKSTDDDLDYNILISCVSFYEKVRR